MNNEHELLRIENLFVNYRTEENLISAVNGISISINKGETLGLVGETGAGKTTVALSIMRLLPERIGNINGGRIAFENEDLTLVQDGVMRLIRGNKISMIFQDPMSSLNPVITVGNQIGEVLQLHTDLNSQEIIVRVKEMLELVGIPAARMQEYPHQFSGGMKQRVVIAMALACNPRLLIADEPTTALDVTIQAQVLEMMEELKCKQGTAMLLITHDLGVVAETCDKVAIMYAGEIIEYGLVEDIYNGDMHHPYTVGLFGSIPNMLENNDRLSPIPGLMPDPTNLPLGCKFHPRCPNCMSICKVNIPEDIFVNGHLVKCHLYSKERK